MSSDFEAFKKADAARRAGEHREAGHRASQDLLEEMDDLDAAAPASVGGLLRSLWNIAAGWLVRIAWTLGLSVWAWLALYSDAGPRDRALKFVLAALVWIPIAAAVTGVWVLVGARARAVLRVLTAAALPIATVVFLWRFVSAS